MAGLLLSDGQLLSGIVPEHNHVRQEDGQGRVRGNKMQIRRSQPTRDWSLPVHVWRVIGAT